MRHNSLHQLTSELVDTYGTIVIERLNIAGLIRNRRLARRPSKICSGCGHVKAKLPLSEREHRCQRCGLALDRDLNAARNLAALVASTESPGVARRRETPVDGDKACRSVGSSSMKREAGTKFMGLDKTGTADWQRPAT